jgi:glycosyltransferase involved in cell wall biosynthesis
MAYTRNEANLGLAGNWNRCLALAETELVALLHADDEVRPGYGRMMCEALMRYPDAAAFCCAADVIDANGRVTTSVPDAVKRVLSPRGKKPVTLSGEDAVAGLLKANFIVCPTLCYVVSKARRPLFDTRWRHVMDLAMTTQLLFDGKSIVWLPQREYRYRRHKENMSVVNTRTAVRFTEMAELYGQVGKAAADRGWNTAARVARKMSIVKMNLTYCLFRDLVRSRGGAAWNKWRILRGLPC